MHPDLAIALYRHHEHELEVRLEQRRAHLEKSDTVGARRPRPHRPLWHPLRGSR